LVCSRAKPHLIAQALGKTPQAREKLDEKLAKSKNLKNRNRLWMV
jgi:hypothetical protein